MNAAGVAAHEALALAVLGALEDGQEPPCRGRDEWTADDPEKRADAATGCQSCHLATPCLTAATTAGERWGIWGGRDFHQRTTTTRNNA